jgi:hypothetical protein
MSPKPPPAASGSRRWLAVAVALGLLWLLERQPAMASFEFTRPSWDSSSELLELARKKLGKNRVVLAAQLDWSKLKPEDGVLVLHPQARLQFADASAFLSEGGRLAVLDDFGKAETLLNRFRIQRVSAPSRPLEMLQGNPNLQLARPAYAYSQAGAALTHPILEGIDHVVTNHPTALATSSDVELTAVLNLSDDQGQERLFAVIGVIGDVAACGLDDPAERTHRARCGRLFAMGDPSVFIDLMMTFEGNRKLAAALIDYLLQDDGWGSRGGKLYVLSNDFSQAGHFGEEETLQQRLSQALDDASQWLAQVRNEGLPERASWLLAALFGLAAAATALMLSGRTYQRPTPRYALPIPLVAQGGVAGRAAVLSSATTASTLVVVELKKAMDAFLRERLELPRHANSQQLLQALSASRALPESTRRELEDVYGKLIRAENSLLIAPENVRFSRESTTHMLAVLQRAIEQLDDPTRRTT